MSTVEVMREAVLIDSMIAIYALTPGDARSSACRDFIRSAAENHNAYASTEMIQEVVFHRMRRYDRATAIADARDLQRSLIVLPFDHEVLEESLRLIEQAPPVRGRDAVHAATAIVYGIDTIASGDGTFDSVPGLRRIDPTDLSDRR